MTPTAPDPAALCRDYLPLAMKLAWRAARPHPWLLPELESAAAVALWKVARTWNPERCPRFATYAHLYIPRELRNRVRAELRHAAPGQVVEHEGEPVSPLALAADHRADGTAAVDARLDLPVMLGLVTAGERAALVGWLAEGETRERVAEACGVAPPTVGQRARAGMRKVRERFG